MIQKITPLERWDLTALPNKSLKRTRNQAALSNSMARARRLAPAFGASRRVMRVKVFTALSLIISGLGIGWPAYQNIMWALWGKHNAWYEYVGLWGCQLMFVSGIIVLKYLKVGSYVALLGYVMMLFYLAPALANTSRRLASGSLVIEPIKVVVLVLIVVVPLLTLGRLCLNVIQFYAKGRA
jgi:hypothetical protein